MQRPVLVLVLVLVAVFVPVACQRHRATAADLPEQSASLLRISDELVGHAVAAADAPERLQEIAAAARAALQLHPTAPAAAMSEAIFDRAGIVREVDDKDVRFVLLPFVLAARRGSCVGLGSLFLAVAPLAGVEARGVLVPGHFYVQVREAGRWRNVELLRRGEEMPDEWYRGKYGALPGPVAGRPLTSDQVVGVVAYDVGNERRKKGRLADARRAYERAVRAFPTYAQAHASLGATLQLLGALDEAAAAYAQARRLDPALPGLDHNVELLERELRGRRDAGAVTSAAGGTAAPAPPAR